MTTAIIDVIDEREKQIAQGRTYEHDDTVNSAGELVDAAVCYALNNDDIWPWEMNTWKPKDQRKNLVRAAALLIAEIESIDRFNAVS